MSKKRRASTKPNMRTHCDGSMYWVFNTAASLLLRSASACWVVVVVVVSHWNSFDSWRSCTGRDVDRSNGTK